MKNFFSLEFDHLGWFFYLLRIILFKANLLLFRYPIFIFCQIMGVNVGKNVVFNGFPVIRRAPRSKICINDGCKLNSSKRSVIIGLKNRCTFATINDISEIHIGKNSGLTGITIVSGSRISIGENVLIGAYCTIIDSDFHNANPSRRSSYKFESKPVTIEDNVFIGMNCTILKGVTIGKNSVIAANSVVISSIPPNSLAMGNPCKMILKRDWEQKE